MLLSLIFILKIWQNLSFIVLLAPELPALERRNWLIHLHYVRKEFEVYRLSRFKIENIILIIQH